MTGQLFDFGYSIDEKMKTADLHFVIQELAEYLDLVLITEYMDESLVLLQRMLCWQLSDVAYIKKRVRQNYASITDKNKVTQYFKYLSTICNFLRQNFNFLYNTTVRYPTSVACLENKFNEKCAVYVAPLQDESTL